MEKQNEQMMVKRYNQRLQKFGYDPKTIGWPKSRHFLRYEILLSQWNLNQKTLLDFGCGFGDLFSYLQHKGEKAHYTGIDINSELIKEAQRRNPEASFICQNVATNKFEQQFDYIVSSGVFNITLENHESFIEKMFLWFDEHSRLGFAVNFLSNKVDFCGAENYHADPCKILELCYKYSNRVVLRNDYMPFEFTVFVNKDDLFDQELTIYPEFKKFVTDFLPT